MIFEAGPTDYLEAVRRSFSSSLVVVRGLITEEEVARIRVHVPEVGRRRVYTRPHLWRPLGSSIEAISRTRTETGRIIRANLGLLSTLYLQRPDMLRRGDVAAHIDDRTVALSTSLNLDNHEEPAVLRGQRVCEGDAPYKEIEETWNCSELRSVHDLEDEVEIGVGDAVLIGRGVVHSSITGVERESLVVRTRGVIR